MAKTKRGQGSAKSRNIRRTTRSSKVRKSSWLSRSMQALPFTEAQLQKGLTWTIVAGAVAVAWVGASVTGATAMAYQKFAQIAGNQGFEVNRVEVRGVNRLNELLVYEVVLAHKDQAMPLVDLADVRSRLMQYGWIEDARVSRQLPDTLVVDIVERTPHAVWEHDGVYSLVDRNGVLLERIDAKQDRRLLHVRGTEANTMLPELARLMDKAPALAPHIVSAEWIGSRRWNIGFKTGEVLALPEGETEASKALLTFAKMEGINRLLGQGMTYFDLRDPERAYFRMAGRAEEVAEN
jgi:cell division protein FtsQ